MIQLHQNPVIKKKIRKIDQLFVQMRILIQMKVHSNNRLLVVTFGSRKIKVLEDWGKGPFAIKEADELRHKQSGKMINNNNFMLNDATMPKGL